MSTPLFKALQKRSSGVLLHISSLPSEQGIGSLGYSARAFIDFLAEAGFSFWQVCPIGPTGYGDSPYQSFSAFAGNPYFIDLKVLEGVGLLKWQELDCLKQLAIDKVDFGNLYTSFWPVLKAAYKRYLENPSFISQKDLQAFKKRNILWLYPYACFMACKGHFKGAPYWEWPKNMRNFASAQKTKLLNELEDSIQSWIFYQYLFWEQWQSLKAYANSKKISLIGDIPIFVAQDSADLWTWPELFDVDKEGLPKSQSGVPPDYFSETGQLWGNPLFRWDVMSQGGYRWWVGRFERNFAHFDILRLDHFRGFDSYWEVPSKALDARQGQWLQGPGLSFFQAIKQHFPEGQFIAEDLGDLSPSAKQLLLDTGFPGMGILQFAFGGESNNPYLPHNHHHNLVIYPGSHDNNTSRAWYQEADAHTKDHFRRYLHVNGHEAEWDLIRSALASPAVLAILSMQDILSLGAEARMNTPGRADANWTWRYKSHVFNLLKEKGTLSYLKELNQLYARCF